MAGGFIKVNVGELAESGSKVVNLANDYNEKIKYIYDKIQELSDTAFVGDEMRKSYLPKMTEYRPIMNALGNCIKEYGDFMTGAAARYRAVQDDAAGRAGNL